MISLSTGCKFRDKNTTETESVISFDSTKKLTADSVAIEEVMKLGNIYWADPYVVVSNVSPSAEFHFSVFDKDLKFLYNFCHVGQGPDECLMPTVVKDMPCGRFMLRDHATDKFLEFRLSDQCAELINNTKLESNDKNEFLWEINHIDGDKYLAKGTAPQKIMTWLIDFRTSTYLDSIAQPFDLPSIMGKDYYPEFDDFWLCAVEDKFVRAYYFINRIEFGSLKNNKLSVDKFIGEQNPPDFYKYTNEKRDKTEGEYEFNVDYNPVFYEWLFVTEKNVFASYFGKPWGDIDLHSSTVMMFSWEGTPEVNFDLDIPVSSFIIISTDDKMKLIGINPDLSNDYFYTYSL